MKTMIIDKDIKNIELYDECGIDRIFIDLETIGKDTRQGHLDTVMSTHTLDDVKKTKSVLKNSELLVRVNPIHPNSATEISITIENGADIIMLPMFKTTDEVELFINYVNKQAKVCLLLETSQALCRIDDILEIDGIDEIHIGLNDLHLSLGLDFMFEIMGSSLLEYITSKIKAKNIPFGIGGVARMDEGMLMGKIIIKEHVRLGSSMVILSRTFKGEGPIKKNVLKDELNKIDEEVVIAGNMSKEALLDNKLILNKHTRNIRKIIKGKQHK